MRKAAIAKRLLIYGAAIYFVIAGIGYYRDHHFTDADIPTCPCTECDCGPPMDTKGDSHAG